MRCDIWVPQRVALSMKVGYFMADFYAQNEQRLYPNIRDAGRRYLIGCEGAQFLGWEEAAARLDYEREQARRRREAG